MKELLVVVDMQGDFISGPLGTREARAILPAVRKEAAAFRARGGEVAFTRDTHGEDYLSTQEGKRLPVVHCVKGGDGWQLAEGLFCAGDRVFDKPSFGSLALAEYVRAGGYGRVELVGVCTDICVVSNALLIKAALPEADLTVNGALCAGVTPQKHEAALETMRSCQVEVL